MIRIEDLKAGYVPGINVLRGISVELTDDQITSIIGPNGAGKSTLLKTIYGFVNHSTGTVTYNGVNLQNYSPPELLREIGIAYIPQERSVFPEMTVHENLELGAWTIRKDDERTSEAIEHVYDQFPALDKKRRAHAGTMSGGQQRMLEIGRSLITEPETVLIDEPSAGLAPDLSEDVYNAVENLYQEGTTVILVDQNIRAAVDYGHELIIMEQGKITEQEKTEEMTDRVKSLVSDWISAKGEIA